MLSYLALGDSYTVGEGVALFESFPYQLVQQLRNANINCTGPEIVAKTGWTTDELLAHIRSHVFASEYGVITLLAGVNNQYRGRPLEEFSSQFAALVDVASELCGGNSQRVFILSIPNWGLTPFAADRNIELITKEIDSYNNLIEEYAKKASCPFIDITSTIDASTDIELLLTEDKLHPSAREYKRWATAVFNQLKTVYNR